MNTSTPTTTNETTLPRLPPELMAPILQSLAREKDYRTLSRVQRTSRDLYLIATPLLYHNLGPNLEDVLASLQPLFLIDPSGDHKLDLTTTESNEAADNARHPIDQSRLNRLLWQYSKVKRLLYEPTNENVGWYEAQENRQALHEHLGRLSRAIQTHQPDFNLKLLLPQAKNMVINLANLPLRRRFSDDLDHDGYESDDTIDECHYQGDEWGQRHPPIKDFLEFFIAYSTPTRICLNLEGHPLYGNCSLFNADFGKVLNRYGAEYIIIHQKTNAGTIFEFPIAKNVVIDVHPYYKGLGPRTKAIKAALDYVGFCDVVSDKPKLLVQKMECNEEEEGDFRRRMDRLTSIPAENWGRVQTKAFKLEWDFLGDEGRVEGCDLCHSMFSMTSNGRD